MNLKFDMNTAPFRIAAQRAVRELKADAPELIREEARLFVGEFMKLSPPFAKGNYGKSLGNDADFTAGRKTITHDLAQVADKAELGYLQHIADTFGTMHVKQQLFKKGTNKPYLIDWDKIAFSLSDLRDHHRKKMNKRGRPPNHYKEGDMARGSADKTIGRWVAKEKVIVPFGVYYHYLTSLIENIGSAKAAFNAAAFRLGMKRVPWFVKRHGALGSYSESGAGEKFSVEIGGKSFVPGAQGAVNMAVAIRGKKLTAEIQRIVKTFAATGKILTRRKSFNAS